jgi:putative ABC transport system ATP-binding protein
MSDQAVFCRGLRKDYKTQSGEVNALRGIDLEVEPGQSLAITGPSGCGKTTLLNILGALDRPTAGEIRVFGQDLSSLNSQERAVYRRRVVGCVFQQFHLIQTLTAEENVALPLKYAGVPRKERRALACERLEGVGLAERRDHFPLMLSGGEKQRVAIARSLIGGSKLLLADEPTGNLDGKTAEDVVALLLGLVDDGMTLVVVTHDPKVAGLMSRGLELQDGQIRSTKGLLP